MLAGVITGSGLILAHVDVVHAAPIDAGPSTTADIPSESTVERSAPATTQWPTPEPTERVVTATTQWPAPTAPADVTSTTATATAGTTATTVAETAAPTTATAPPTSSPSTSSPSTSSPSTSPEDVGTGLAPVPAEDADVIVAQGGPVLPAAELPAASTAATTGTLPVTGQSMELPVGSGVALALIGAALLRLRRRPSWD